jgi:hypothetical protein
MTRRPDIAKLETIGDAAPPLFHITGIANIAVAPQARPL